MSAPPSPEHARRTGVILAGGQARRMQNRDKGLLPYRGRPLVAHAIARLRPQVDQLLINAGRNHSEYARFGYPLVADSHAGFLGPLAGICAALRCAPPGAVVCVPCDCPQLHPQLASRLLAAFADGEARIAVAVSGGRMQPVFAAFCTGLADDLETFLEEGGRKVDAFYARHACREVAFDHPECFRNINTPEELAGA